MELALYCPDYGYYEKEGTQSVRRGDFFTSVSVGELFGELLAISIFNVARSETTPDEDRPQLVEAGATRRDNWRRDILAWLRENRPDAFCKPEYMIVEPSGAGDRQRKRLAESRGKVRWFSRPGRTWPCRSRSPPGVHGSNFFQRIARRHAGAARLAGTPLERQWFEWGVALDG